MHGSTVYGPISVALLGFHSPSAYGQDAPLQLPAQSILEGEPSNIATPTYVGKVIEYAYDAAGNRVAIAVRKPRIVAVPIGGMKLIPLD